MPDDKGNDPDAEPDGGSTESADASPSTESADASPSTESADASPSTEGADASPASNNDAAGAGNKPPKPYILPKLPEDLISRLAGLEKTLGRPILWLVQRSGSGDLWSYLSAKVEQRLRNHIHAMPADAGKPLLVIESDGGHARCAYRIARALQKRGGFDALVLGRAKSAATLLVVGAETIYMGRNAELGPLDVQIPDLAREKVMSGLEIAQSLQALHVFSIQAIEDLMMHLLKRSGKKSSDLLPQACSFVAAFMRPLLEKIDAVEYTQMARNLRVATDYATRLMKDSYGEGAAEIASGLVEDYPDHDFVIDADEAADIGLRISTEGKELALFQGIFPQLPPWVLVGRLPNAGT